ncbi:MAG: hypothetical protein WCN92_12265 [Eubacteriales bacterium]
MNDFTIRSGDCIWQISLPALLEQAPYPQIKKLFSYFFADPETDAVLAVKFNTGILGEIVKAELSMLKKTAELEKVTAEYNAICQQVARFGSTVTKEMTAEHFRLLEDYRETQKELKNQKRAFERRLKIMTFYEIEKLKRSNYHVSK